MSGYNREKYSLQGSLGIETESGEDVSTFLFFFETKPQQFRRVTITVFYEHARPCYEQSCCYD